MRQHLNSNTLGGQRDSAHAKSIDPDRQLKPEATALGNGIQSARAGDETPEHDKSD
jgi:hypothetical protein